MNSFSIRSFLRIAIWTIMVSASVCNVVGQNSDRQLTARNKCSVFEVQKINGLAWRKGDFLFRRTSTMDTINRPNKKLNLDGILIESVELCRVAFDFDSNQFCVLKWQRDTIVDLKQVDKNRNPRVETTTMIGISLGIDNRLFSRTFPKKLLVKKLSLKKEEPDFDANFQKHFRALFNQNVPDFRGIGLSRWGSSGSFKVASDRADKLKTGIQLFSDKDLGNDRFELQIKSPGSGVVSYQIDKFIFDGKLNLPILVDEILHVTSPAEGQPAVALFCSQRIEWREINGVHAPRVISREQSRQMRVGQEQNRYTGRQFVDIDFHWFGLNEPTKKIPKALFNGNCMKDMESFLNFVDPSKAGAVSLIPDTPENKQEPKE